jgi:hypothetical protein
MATISPRDTVSLKCLGTEDQQHQILRGNTILGNVDLGEHDDSNLFRKQWGAIDAGSSQVFLRCLEEVKSSKFKTAGLIQQGFFLEGKSNGTVGLALKTAAEDPTLTGTRWTVIDLGGDQLVLQCALGTSPTKSTVKGHPSPIFLNGQNGKVNLAADNKAIGTHWQIVALQPPGDLHDPPGLHTQH